MRLAFVGVGRIATALVEGLAAPGGETHQIYLSPRAADQARQLAAAYGSVEVAHTNQAAVDAADVVFLCVRPSDAQRALEEVRFGSHHCLVSVVALTPLALLTKWAGATTVVRAVPLPSARRRESPTVFYPDHPLARQLFDSVGWAIPLRSEHELNATTAVTALLRPIAELVQSTEGWLVDLGVHPSTAVRFVAPTFRSMLQGDPRTGVPTSTANDTTTPGGLNEQALSLFLESGAIESVTAILDAVLRRIDDADGIQLPFHPEGGRT